jgi:UDP-glucose 4-epimerase
VLPTPENYPIRPLAPYGQGKYAAEGYCELYTRLYGLATVSLRYGNVYGPRQDVHGEAGVVAIFCGAVVDGRRPTVFGDGRQTRDWVDVSDVARANLTAAEADVTGPFNIGRGEETSVLDLIGALNDVSKRGPLEDPEFAPERPGEVRRSCLDVSRARRELGWEPKTELRQGLRRILEEL